MRRIDESSVEELYASAVNAFPATTKRQHAVDPIVVEELRWTPFRGMGTLYVKGVIRNEMKHYDTSILFKGVDYTQKNVTLMASDGLLYEMGRLSLENDDVLVRCNCPDFKWRFSFYNHLDKSLYGRKPRKYEAVTSRPPANPQQMPGMCKHVMATVRALQHAGLLI